MEQKDSKEGVMDNVGGDAAGLGEGAVVSGGAVASRGGAASSAAAQSAPSTGSKRRAKGDSSDDDDDDESETADPAVKGEKKSGRRKINIEFIEDKSRRHITFSKRKAGIMKKAYELSTLTGTQVLLLVASETGHVYTFATPKLQPLITKPEGKNLIQACLNSSDAPAMQQPTRMYESQAEPMPPNPAQQMLPVMGGHHDQVHMPNSYSMGGSLPYQPQYGNYQNPMTGIPPAYMGGALGTRHFFFFIIVCC